MSTPPTGNASAPVERIPSRGDKAGPVLAGICAAVFLVAVFGDGVQRSDLPVLAAIPVLLAMTWALYVRPRLELQGEVLRLKGAFEDVDVPLAAIERVDIGRVFVAHTGAGRYISTSQSRPLRHMLMPGRVQQATKMSEINPADFLIDKLHRLAQEARERAGIASMSDEQLALAASVTKRKVWPVIGTILALWAVFGLSIVYVAS